jgi:hypothetical protein
MNTSEVSIDKTVVILRPTKEAEESGVGGVFKEKTAPDPSSRFAGPNNWIFFLLKASLRMTNIEAP